MSKDEFEQEWRLVVRDPYDAVPNRPYGDWYHYVPTKIPELSLEAKHYIVDNPEEFGDWIIEIALDYYVDRALGLEVV